MTTNPLHATVTQRAVLLTPDERILTVQRTTDSGWELPGGRLDAHEDAQTGLQRELTEETGLTPTIVTPVHTHAWRNDTDNGRFAVYYYGHTPQKPVTLSTEHTTAAWQHPSTATTNLSDPQQTAVKKTLTTHQTHPPHR